MADFTTAVQAAGFSVKESLKVYEYIKQDHTNIQCVYSADINQSITAIDRMQRVAAKWFAGKEEQLCQFFVNAEAEVKALISEMGL